MIGDFIRFLTRLFLLRAAYRFITRLTSRPRSTR